MRLHGVFCYDILITENPEEKGDMDMTVDVEKLFRELGNLLEVEAIALGGSRATGRQDETSDYDV